MGLHDIGFCAGVDRWHPVSDINIMWYADVEVVKLQVSRRCAMTSVEHRGEVLLWEVLLEQIVR